MSANSYDLYNLKRETIEEPERSGFSTLREMIFWILDDSVSRGDPEPKTGKIADLVGRSPQSISRIKKFWRSYRSIEDWDSVLVKVEVV